MADWTPGARSAILLGSPDFAGGFCLGIKDRIMGYKFKPNKGCVKRFKVTATGKVKRRGTFSTHLRSRRDAALKRRQGRPSILAEGHARNMRRFMGVSKIKPLQVAHARRILAQKQAEAAE